MEKETINLFLLSFVLLFLVPISFAATGSYGSYNSETKFSFVGYDSSSGSGHNSRGSNQITGSFSIGTTYSGRFGILKYCGNSIIDSGETCDGTNLNSQTCSSRGYLSGTLACKADCSGFDTSGCTPKTAEVQEVPSGSFSGEEIPRTTKQSVAISEEEVKVGTLQVLTTNAEYSVTLRGMEHRIDVKQITADSVVLWIYPEPVEVFLEIGEHKRVDLDGDGFGDVWVELKDIRKVVVFDVGSYEAVIFLREMSPVTGAVVREEEVEVPADVEEFELPKIALLPKDLISGKVSEKAWVKAVQDFQSFIKANVDYWINQAKTKKSWQISSIIIASIIILISTVSFSFFIRRKILKKPENPGLAEK